MRKSEAVDKLEKGPENRDTAVLRSLFDDSPLMMGVVEIIDEDILHVVDNAASARILGLAPESMRGRTASALGVPPDAVREWIVRCRESERTGRPVRFEYAHETRDGLRRLSTSVVFIGIGPGGRPRFSYLADDVTDRRRMEEEVIEANRNFRRFFDQSPIGAAVVTLDGRFQRVNNALCRITGYGPKELAALGFSAVVHPDDRDADRDQARRLESGEIDEYRTEKRFIRKDGEVRRVRLHVRQVKSPSGRPLYFLPMMEDVTEQRRQEEELASHRHHLEELIGARTAELLAANRKLRLEIAERERAEEALRASNESLRALIHASPLAIIALDASGRITLWNLAAEKTFGWTEGEVFGRPNPIVAGERQEEYARILGGVMRGEAVSDVATRRRRKDGTDIDVILHAAPLRDGQGRIHGGIAVVADVTAQKTAARQMQRQAQMLDLANEPILILDNRNSITYWNRGAERLYGWTKEEALGKDIRTLFRTEFPEPYEEIEERLLQQGRWEGELVRTRADGERIIVASRWTLWLDERGHPSAILEIGDDITARKGAEEALRVSEERYRSFVQNFQGIAYQTDIRFMPVFLHGAVEKITGYIECEFLLGKPPWEEIVHPDDRPAFLESGRKVREAPGRSAEIEYRIIRRDGQVRWVHDISQSLPGPNGAPAYCQGAVYDITELKRAQEELRRSEEQLRQSQKMEAIGRLAGGIAHDFNNLLTAILGYSEVLLHRLPAEGPLRREVEEIKKAGDRASSLTRQLLAFSRRQVLQPKVLDLNAIVASMENMLRRLIGEDIELVTVLGRRLGAVKADPGQLEQVIVNLVVNARDAMPEGGRLTVETGRSEGHGETGILPPPGGWVVLSVTDTGVGMDEETRAHLFEPFYTTKGPGKGTGLGLSTVYGIVAQSGGHIAVESEPGRGTTFRIYLPRAEEERPGEAGRPRLFAIPGRGTETILLVEDEEAVRSLASEILRMNGYSVLEAADGEEALLLSGQHAGPIALLLTDVVMPRLSGFELARRLRTLRPGLKVLYMSGHTDIADIPPEGLASGAAYIQKPFTPGVLARTVRALLDAPAG
jgi:two-component system, cell cycle sensor histidine kinase and response regulator CckA